MRKTFLLSLAIIAFTSLSAQKAFKQTTFYGEIMGNGLTISVNYERQLSDKPGLGLHIGLGLGSEMPVIPIGAKYLFKLKNEKSFIEAGLGITLTDYSFSTLKHNVDNNRLKAAFIPSVGYRHHTSYGLMWRLNYTPVFLNYRSIWYVGGFSIGWRL
jgi:hypothetical protein